MIHSVSPVSFRSNTVAAAPQDPISRPGRFTTVDTAPKAASPKKKGGFWKGLAITVASLAVVAGALVAGVKTGKLNKVEDLANAKFMQKVGHYLAEAGNWVDTKMWQPIVKLFNKKDAAAPVTE